MMDNKKAIEILREHLAHWERLLQENICEEEEGRNTIEAINRAIFALGNERPIGEWIEEPDTLGVIEKGNAKYRCSCCGRTDIQAKSLDVPYCWFCGAEMKEKDIDED